MLARCQSRQQRKQNVEDMCGNEHGKEKRLPKPHGFAGNRAHEGHVGQSDRGIEELSIGQSASMYRMMVLTNIHALYRKLLSLIYLQGGAQS